MIKIKSAPKKATEHFPCSDCGAILKFAPGTQSLVCEYCGIENQIAENTAVIHEYNLQQALQHYQNLDSKTRAIKIQCLDCGAGFQFEHSVHAGECPFCGTPVVSQVDSKRIQPKSLLPFLIDDEMAKSQFQKWIRSLWFAPNAVKRFVRSESKLTGVYLPYWTFDSQTQTDYSGMRGDTYYVTQPVRVTHKGRVVIRQKRVPKIRWTPVSGRVKRFFDDVLIGASHSLPRGILDALQPWDLQQLIAYDEQYLSGYGSEFYQLQLDEGFDYATQVMAKVISRDIAYDIGGDHQRIQHKNTQHRNRTYKHCLLPVWMASFNYRHKTYRFAINGCTGKVQGERPFSVWKIGFTVVLILITIGAIVFYQDVIDISQTEKIMPGEVFYRTPY